MALTLIDSFKAGNQIQYDVIYLGRGPVETTIPDRILNTTMKTTGTLSFSLEDVTFEGKLFDDEDLELEFILQFSLDQIESEKACRETKIVFITLLPDHGEQRRYYFNVAEDGDRGRAVYHPQWVNFGKRYVKRQRAPENED